MPEHTGRLFTPAHSADVALWCVALPAEDLAYLHGCAFQCLAMLQGITELELYQEFARRAAADPDCQVVRPL